MPKIQTITPCLWFDDQAEEAANFYVGIFPNSKVGAISRYTEAGQEYHRRKPGTVLTIAFELDGEPFTGLNGGPQYKFTEAVSFQINCETQADVDHYWGKLSAGGDEKSQQCGWLKDKFGVSWQVVPNILPKLLTGSDAKRGQRVFMAMMGMKKLIIADLEKA
jgi:predicted 3-demethylubiquinone-9 3-methyltransferase (glyoxalase superfamily)